MNTLQTLPSHFFSELQAFSMEPEGRDSKRGMGTGMVNEEYDVTRRWCLEEYEYRIF
jgi:hypothetical protein